MLIKRFDTAARWNFLTFQSPSYSAVLMQFVTPPSYGSTTVAVGGITQAQNLLFANANPTATHTQSKQDVNAWPEPTSGKYTWSGKTKEGQDVTASLEGDLGQRLDKVDVMAEVPAFVKQIVAAAAGTKPYIYQVSSANYMSNGTALY